MALILSIDAGTTSVRSSCFDDRGQPLAQRQQEFTQHFPRPGWVEHDLDEIWSTVRATALGAVAAAGASVDDVTCIGITNQRETVCVWDRRTLRPVARAIVWQDRRTSGMCDELVEAGHGERIRQVSGLVVDPYFSGTKLSWLLRSDAELRKRAEEGELAFGTLDTWLIACMSSGRAHVTEPSNACRTMLWDLVEGGWSEQLCDLLDVPTAMLADVRDSSGAIAHSDPAAFGGIDAPVTGVAGDQQAALFGQGCWQPGTSKNTYGTGSFLLLNTGARPAIGDGGLLTSAGWRLDGATTFVLEGAIFSTGASVQWLRDGLGMLDDAASSERLAAQVPDGNEGVYLVPAFTGLGAPHWDPHARAALLGMTRGTGRAHLARAALEAMAYQTVDVMRLMEQVSGDPVAELRVDGGASANDLLCQFQADVLDTAVVRPRMRETTVLGAAYLAGLGAGVWSSTEELEGIWQLDRRFEPSIGAATRDRMLRGWHQAVTRAGGWTLDDENASNARP